MSRTRLYAFLLVVVAGIWAVDQLTKAWIRARLWPGATLPLLSGPLPVRLVHWYNTGGIFGLFQNYPWFWTALGVTITLLLVQVYPRLARRTLLRWGLALQLGGALGNLTDRILRGHVTDFIAVGNFPVFNLADAAITVGIALMLLESLRTENEQERPQDTERPEFPPLPDPASSETPPEKPLE